MTKNDQSDLYLRRAIRHGIATLSRAPHIQPPIQAITRSRGSTSEGTEQKEQKEHNADAAQKWREDESTVPFVQVTVSGGGGRYTE
jgi:hypothetical protein